MIPRAATQFTAVDVVLNMQDKLEIAKQKLQVIEQKQTCKHLFNQKLSSWLI